MNKYAIPLLIMFVSAAILVFYVDGGYRVVTKLLDEEVSLLGYLEDARKAQSKIDALTTEYDAFPDDADARLNVLLPNERDPVLFMIDIDNLAKIHGLQVGNVDVSMTPPAQDSADPLLRYQVSFSLIATYDTFSSFMEDVERSLSLKDIGSISVAITTGKGALDSKVVTGLDQVLTFDVDLVGYSLKT